MTIRAGSPNERTRPLRAATPSRARPRTQRNALVSAICHDIRAPLASITMGANFVLQTMEDEDPHSRPRRILDAMVRSCGSLERLVRNLRDMADLDGDMLALELGEYDVKEIAILAAEAIKGPRSVRLEIGEIAAPHVRCDRERLVRAVVHLLENAVKAAPEGTDVTISVRSTEARVSYAVSDTGPGISDAARARALTPISKRSRPSGGLQLGLAIVRGLARAHGGRLILDSRPGRTVCTVDVPVTGPGPKRLRARRPAARSS